MLPLRDNVPSSRRPVMMWAIIAANVAVFLFQMTLPADAREQFIRTFGVVAARYVHHDWQDPLGVPPGPAAPWWPFLTSLFVHGSVLHILANMWVFWIFGDNVEDRMGRWRFLAFYLLCGFAADDAQFLADPYSTLPSIGASGAIAGVMGGYFILYPRAKILMVLPIFFFPFFFAVPAAFFALYWFFLQIVSGAASLGAQQQGGVAWWAHVGGFITGMLLIRVFARGPMGWSRGRPRPTYPGPPPSAG